MIFLGRPWVETFVTMFEYDKGKMKFGLNVNAADGASIIGPPKPKTMSPGKKFGIVCLVFGVFAIIVITLVYIWRCRRASQAR